MRALPLICLMTIFSSFGCRWGGQQQYPMGGAYPQQGIYQPPINGYEQTFPPQQMPAAPPSQFGQNAGRFLGDMAKGFVRSAVGGAGFTAGRDLWNEIVR